MTSFEVLPRELQLIIITDYLQPAPPEPQSKFALFFRIRREPQPTLDIGLALQLAIVSPSCRDIVSSLIFRHIRITRPSALHQLCSTLGRRPELASLINSMHLGPVRDEEASHWPFLAPDEGAAPFFSLRSSLTTREAPLLPHWCPSGFVSRIPDNVQNCVYAAVDRAIEEAVKGLDIEPTRRGYSKSGIVIGLREWVARCFLLAAALDLYLIEMRRLEDNLEYDVWNGSGSIPEACRKSRCGHAYPRYEMSFERCKLPSTGQDVSAAGSGETGWTFTVKEAQLWEQLERPGGPGDDFDHLTLFTNSTRAGLGMSDKEWQRVRAALRGPCPQRFTNIDWLKRMGYDPCDELDEPSAHPDDSEEEEEEDKWPHPSSSASEDFNIGRATRKGRSEKAEDLLNMARRLLSLATEVENLSLTGIFFRALPALQARSLRALTVGPHPHYWNDVLPVEAVVRLGHLVKLRVVGKMSKEDASRIAYEVPRLEHFEWEMIERGLSLQKIYDNIRALQGLRNLADSYAGQGENPPRKRIRYSLESSSSDGSSACSGSGSTIHEASSAPSSAATNPTPPQRRTLVLLRREIVREVCSMTPFQEVPDSWQGDGRRLEHNLHGVEVEGSEAAESNPEVLQGRHYSSREVAALYAAGQQWWWEGNVGAGVFGREGCGEGERRRG